ncbi:MAG TPA: CBS domain-containing protein [Acidimicrobiales bacterium]|nr:CBS domain-containing protein [Acidimicrobiales bacterium]
MEIGPLITRAVLTVEESDSLQDAAEWMMERGVGSAVVLNSDGVPSGIITDRDTLRIVAQGIDGSATTVGACLTRKLVTATPSMEVLEAARIMREKGFRHLVVVNERGALEGLFSMRDLVVGLLQERNVSSQAAVVGAEAAPGTS